MLEVIQTSLTPSGSSERKIWVFRPSRLTIETDFLNANIGNEFEITEKHHIGAFADGHAVRSRTH